MGEPRNVGRIRSRAGRRRTTALPLHYITEDESEAITRRLREREEARGIFRRWNDRQLTPEQRQLHPRRERLKAKG